MTETDALIAAHKRTRVWCEGEQSGFTSAFSCKCGVIGRGFIDDAAAVDQWVDHVSETAWAVDEREWFEFEKLRGRRYTYVATVTGSEDLADWHDLGFGSLAGAIVGAREFEGVDELQRVDAATGAVDDRFIV